MRSCNDNRRRREAAYRKGWLRAMAAVATVATGLHAGGHLTQHALRELTRATHAEPPPDPPPPRRPGRTAPGPAVHHKDKEKDRHDDQP